MEFYVITGEPLNRIRAGDTERMVGGVPQSREFRTVLLRKYVPKLPGFLIAVGGAAALVAIFSFPVETIGSRFGGVPSTLPAPIFPTVASLSQITAGPKRTFARRGRNRLTGAS